MSSAHALPASPTATLRPSRGLGFLPRFAWLVLAYNVAVILGAPWSVPRARAQVVAIIGRCATGSWSRPIRNWLR